MAFDDAPSGWLGAGYTASANAIHLQTNDAGSNKTLPMLTDAEAHATTGDIRKIYLAVCEAIYQSYNDKAVADRPAMMSLYRSDAVNSETGIITRTYNFQFKLADPAVEVSDE